MKLRNRNSLVAKTSVLTAIFVATVISVSLWGDDHVGPRLLSTEEEGEKHSLLAGGKITPTPPLEPTTFVIFYALVSSAIAIIVAIGLRIPHIMS